MLRLKKFETIQCNDENNSVLTVMLNRPKSLNAINTLLGCEMLELFRFLNDGNHDYRYAVISGRGRAFCAGGDLKERVNLDEEGWNRQHRIFENMFFEMLSCPLPIIGAINGIAFGGGAEIALCCDFMYAAESAVFAFPEARLGIIPGGGGTQNLARAVGIRRAKELIFTGEQLNSYEAQKVGIVNKVTADDNLFAAIDELLEKLGDGSYQAIRQAKKAIQFGARVDLLSGYRYEIEAYNNLIGRPDQLIGVEAFIRKRNPKFL